MAMTGMSSPPTMSSVGARTRGRAEAARSGRPPRETIAAMAGSPAAAMRAAAAPVLAPRALGPLPEEMRMTLTATTTVTAISSESR
jgi:hypothetical protein